MTRRQESVITEHRFGAPPPGSDVLCATVVIGEHSFSIELVASGALELGRGADSDLQLASGGVSRAHAKMTVTGERALLEDLGSRNGTFVNRVRINGPCAVGPGDEIAIGDARLSLLRKSALPGDVPTVRVRRAFIASLDEAIAGGERPSVFAVQLPERWYEVRAARGLLHQTGIAEAGFYNEQILVFAVRASRAEPLAVHASCTRALRLAGVDTVSGMAGETRGDGEEILNSALKALLSASEPDEETAGRPILADPAMIRLHAEARRLALSPLSILLVGETGVGKEIFARTIHQASGRSGPLVCINTAALPEQLLESELFGHEKGAFSGAASAKQGLIEAAHGGTLFLDEIGELPLSMQAKLLRVLEEHSVRRVGATVERKIDVRIVAATNCDLEQSVIDRRFRQDLLFRLNGCTLSIPPLRERKAEIGRLAAAFLARATVPLGGRALHITPAALALLEQHAWPGNVRELRNVIERAAALAMPAGSPIGAEHLPLSLREPVGRAASLSPPALASDDVRDSVREFERQRIVQALQQAGGNQTHAAELLGLPRRTFAYKMARLGIRAK